MKLVNEIAINAQIFFFRSTELQIPAMQLLFLCSSVDQQKNLFSLVNDSNASALVSLKLHKFSVAIYFSGILIISPTHKI